MASDIQDPVCWRAARPCPLSDSSPSQKLICQAWFRCEVAGDYVIRWRCQSFEDGVHNITNTALKLCSNQSDSRELTECPPPVVCADDPSLDKAYLNNSDLSTDVILAIAVSIFAFLAMLLIVVSSYKYWRLRKRLRHRSLQRHYLVRDFPYPVRYHNQWGTGYHHYDKDSSKKSHSSRSYGSPHADVYFSRPQEYSSYFERLLAPSDDFKDNKSGGSGPSTPRHLFSSAGKFTADPSVATGSFVFHQPIGGGGLAGFNGRVDGWIHQNKQMNNDEERKDKSMECYHIYKGNTRKSHTQQPQQQQQHESENYVKNRKEYQCLQTESPDFSHMPQVSSIVIPTYGLGGLQKTMPQHEYISSDLQVREDTGEQFVKTDSSHESMSHYAVGFITRKGKSHHNMINNQGHKNNSRQYHSISPKCVNTTKMARNHPSPDVISSHNFTNRFVRVSKNVYRPLLTKSSSSSSTSLSSSTNNNVDLSYDSFRNEHLRELAKHGAASSSTLEAGYRQKGHEKPTALNSRY